MVRDNINTMKWCSGSASAMGQSIAVFQKNHSSLPFTIRKAYKGKSSCTHFLYQWSSDNSRQSTVNSMVQMTSMFVVVFGFPSGGVEKLLVYSYLDPGLSKLWKGRRKFGKDVWQQFGSSGIQSDTPPWVYKPKVCQRARIPRHSPTQIRAIHFVDRRWGTIFHRQFACAVRERCLRYTSVNMCQF